MSETFTQNLLPCTSHLADKLYVRRHILWEFLKPGDPKNPERSGDGKWPMWLTLHPNMYVQCIYNPEGPYIQLLRN